ncbi:MAG: iron-sulfur cluster repair protein YtfE [Gemmatimonadetes bacterium]|nr:iron-sulfur cluster repair protein YtfE [Gemmatimonadota bacterium]
MNPSPGPRTSLADLATRFPAASRILRRERLDYCCGGRRSLEDACRSRGLDPQALLLEMEEAAAPAPAVDWTTRPLDELVRHIVGHYHEPLRDELPELVALARKVESVHRDKASVPRGLADHLIVMEREVREHLAKEEQVLFPLILAGHGADAGAPVQMMETEHQDHGRNLAHVREITGDLTPPADACTTWRALYLRLATLESELMDHIHLENNVLFPRALCE